MRINLTLLSLLCVCSAAIADTGLKGTLTDAQTGKPVADANILLRDQAIFVVSGSDGVFTISNAAPGPDVLEIIAPGYNDSFTDVSITDGIVKNIGEIKLTPAGFEASSLDSVDFLFDETQIMDESDVSQSVGTILGAVDDIYYQAANFDFTTARFRLRGYSDDWTDSYINGIKYNDAMRNKFNYSGLGGMTSSAFRNRTVDVGLAAASYGFGGLGGSTDFTTYASQYAPGFRGNLSYTNSSYMLRAMLQYSTGLMSNGWAVSASVIGRYAPEGVGPIEGTWYNALGYSLSVEKIFNDRHRLNLTTWGAPAQRATNSWTCQEAYDLAGSNLYNPNWGYQDGKKRSAKVVTSFDPSVMLNWIWTPKMGTSLNTGVAFRMNSYSSTGLTWYNASDPRADYYHKLPSDHLPTADPGTPLYDAQLEVYEYYRDLWHDKAYRQIDWDALYQANYLNQLEGTDEKMFGRASYALEENHSNFTSAMFNSYLDHRINDILTMQAGVSFNYTNARYFKTMNDLLGATYWLDVDSWAEGDFPGDPDKLQNNLNNPNRKVGVGDKFGYDYNMISYNAHAWIQNQWNFRHWDINYALQFDYTNFHRDGNMRNGRAPENSYGAGKYHGYATGAGKLGVTYKINGRNYIVAHAAAGNRAPTPYSSYVSSRIKDTFMPGIKPETYVSGDLSYVWNFNRFRGSLTGFWTERYHGSEMTFFFDYDHFTNMTYSMSDVRTRFTGIELGMQFKILSNLSISAAGTFANYRYKNNPQGVMTAENGSIEDVYQKVYLKNYRVSNTPQQAYTLGVNYNVKNWFLEVNGVWTGDAYVTAAPTMHTTDFANFLISNDLVSSRSELDETMKKVARQDKLKQGWVFNASVGKVFYTKFGSVNLNLSVNNFANNRGIQTSGKQELKYKANKDRLYLWGNKYYYAQGIRVFLNLGIRF